MSYDKLTSEMTLINMNGRPCFIREFSSAYDLIGKKNKSKICDRHGLPYEHTIIDRIGLTSSRGRFQFKVEKP